MKGTIQDLALRPLALVLAAAVASCGAQGVLVSRGTSVPLDLQRMSGDQLLDYFKAKGGRGYKDGSRLEASIVMVDLAYLKATGQILEATEEEMEALSTRKRFEVHIEYTTPTLFPGETEGEGISIDKWTVTLRDSKGAQIGPSTINFDPPLIEKSASSPEPTLTEKPTSKLFMTYVLKGHAIFEYQVPDDCRWVEIDLVPPLTGHSAKVRWSILN